MKSTFFTLLFFFFLTTLVAQTPKRIVSLAPSLTKSLYYLGADDALVGHTVFCNIAKDDGKEIVASAIQVNVEKVITLKPDLVLVHSITRSQTIDLLKKAGLCVELFNTPRSYDEVCSQFIELGKIVGKEKVAQKIVSETTQQVDSIRNTYKNEPLQKMLFQIGAKPLFTVLDNTYMADFITFSGGVNIAAGLTGGTITREFVLMKNPDAIIIVDMGITGEDEIKIWQNYPDLSAVKQDKIFFIESDMASTPNPPDFLMTMKALRQNL